jgi:lysophospholipase L1-like esterase
MGNKGFSFTTDSRGLRNREPTAADESRRHVVVLGDSVAFGAFVDDQSTFAALLDRQLASRDIAVINTASIFLKGTEQQLRFLLDGWDRLRPDLVLLVFTAKNDFPDNARQEFFRDGVAQPAHPRLFQRLVKASERLPGYRLLAEHSWLFNWFRFYFWNVHARLKDEPGGKRNFPMTASVLRLLREESQRRGARLAMALVPNRQHLAARGPTGRYPEDSEEAVAARYANQIGIPLFDCSEVLADPGATYPDGHLTAAGHRAVAAALGPRILDWLGKAR